MNTKDYLNFSNLLKALRKTCRNVRWKTSITQYELNGLKNSVKLINSATNKTYKISGYRVFQIYEPKKRTIMATRIKDRHLQRSLCDNYLYKCLTKSFIYDNCACQVGKGTHFAIKRMGTHLHKFYRRNKSNQGYYLKCDIHKFFESIDHEKLKQLIQDKIDDVDIRIRIFEIIDSFKGNVGIGLGSQVNQLLALFYLNGMDHLIKEKLKIKNYIRYSDDFILLHPDKQYLIQCRNNISEYLNSLGLTLNNKTIIQKITKGIKFLNMKYILTDTGKVIITSDKKKIRIRKRKIKHMLLSNKNHITLDVVKKTLLGMIGYLKKYNTHKEVMWLISLLNKIETYPNIDKSLLIGKNINQLLINVLI